MPTDGTPANNNPNNGADDKKVEFTAEQQAKVNELIQNAMGRAGREQREKATALESQLTKLSAELEQARTELNNAKTSGERKEAAKDMASLQAEIDRVRNSHNEEVTRFKSELQKERDNAQRANKELVETRKQVAISKAVSELNFVNNDVVSKLTDTNIRWDGEKGKFVVVGDDGNPRMNSSLEPMSLKEFYSEFAAQNPYLVRGDVKAGAGSGSSSRSDVSNNGKYEVKQIFGKESNASLANQLKKSNPQEYARLKQIARDAHLIA